MVKAEGQVTLSISELDRLRLEIKELSEQKEELLKHQGEVLVKVTVTEKYSTCDTVYDGRALDGSGRYRDVYRSVLKDYHRVIDETERYINLEEVEKNIYQDAKSKVITELGESQRQVDSLKRDIENLKTTHVRDGAELKKQYQDLVEELTKTKDDEIKALQKKIDELEGKAVDKTKDDIIRDLTAEIEKLKLKKGFWGFIHS
jgi:chromosome segregation ATPase